MSELDPSLVRAVAAQLLASVQAPASPLLSELWDGYWLAEGKGKKSERDIKGTWKRVGAYRFPDGRTLPQMRTAELGVTFPAVYRDWRIGTTTRLGGPPETGTINRELERLRAVLNWAVSVGLLQPHPLCSMHMPAENNVQQTKIRDEEAFELLLSACAERHHALPALVLLYFDGGLRRLEGIHAKWADLEPKANGGGRLRLVGKRTKSGKPRMPHLTRRTMLQLADLPRVSEWMFANVRVYKNGRKGKWYGEPYNPMYLYRLFLQAVVASGLEPEPGEKITFHTLRRSFAYRARRRWKWPEQVIMRQGGWTTRSAFDRYGIVDDEEQDEAMDVAEAAIHEDTRRGPRPAPPIGGNPVTPQLRLVKNR